jgi:molybdopterin-binding protein
LQAAWQVQSGQADGCIATRAAARVFGLGFIPLVSERYDLAIRRQHLDMPSIQDVAGYAEPLELSPGAGKPGRLRHSRRGPAPALIMVQEDMALSARNQLPGIVESVQIGSIMAHVVVKVGDNLIESVITRTSAEELGLKKGDAVKVVVKSTEVMIQKG